MSRYGDHSNGNGFRVPIIVALAGILMLFGSGFMYLLSVKADKEVVNQIHKDVGEIRTFLMGPRRP